MARNRIIKPKFWEDEKLCKLSFMARLIYIATWNFSDDCGVIQADPIFLKSRIFPYDSISMQKFAQALTELENLDRLRKFESNGESYYFIPNFMKHQQINRRSTQRFAIPPVSFSEGSVRAHGGLSEGSVLNDNDNENVNDNDNDKGKGNAKGEGGSSQSPFKKKGGEKEESGKIKPEWSKFVALISEIDLKHKIEPGKLDYYYAELINIPPEKWDEFFQFWKAEGHSLIISRWMEMIRKYLKTLDKK